jgi:hypothetical protein
LQIRSGAGMSAQILSIAPNGCLPKPTEYIVQCTDSGLYLSDMGVNTVTVTQQRSRAIVLQAIGARRLAENLACMYPSFKWQTLPAQV